MILKKTSYIAAKHYILYNREKSGDRLLLLRRPNSEGIQLFAFDDKQYIQTCVDLSNIVLFLKDGTPLHNVRGVTQFLNENFPNAWIERGNPFNWPRRFTDLTPLDFFSLVICTN